MPFVAPAVVASLALTGAAAATATFLVNTAIGVGLSMGANYLANKILANESQEEMQERTPTGVHRDMYYGGDTPREVAAGRCATGGDLTYINTYGTNNKYLEIVSILSDGWCVGLTSRVQIDGKWKNLTLLSTTGVGNGVKTYSVQDYPNMTLRCYDGRWDQTADAQLISNAQPANRWTSNHRGLGVCYVIARMAWDEKEYKDIPDFFFEFDGARCYDSRIDGTNGGSGAQRYTDWTTFAFKADPATWLYHFRRGFRDPNGNAIVGMNHTAEELSAPHYQTAANLCDENVALGGGGNEKRYEIGMFLSAGRPHIDNLEGLQNAFAGYECEREGYFVAIPGASQTPVLTITDDDILVEGEEEITDKLPRDQLANSIGGTYTEPGDDYESADFEPLIDLDMEAEDGGERLVATLDLASVQSKPRARRIASIRLRENRRQYNGSIPVTYRMLALQAGEWFTWNSQKWGNKTWIATEVTESPNGSLRWRIRETHSTVFSSAHLPNTVYTPPDPHGSGTFVDRPQNLVAIPDVDEAANGRQRPVFRMTHTPPDDRKVRATIFRYRINGTTRWRKDRDDDPEEGEHKLTSAIIPGGIYEIQARWSRSDNKQEPWTSSVISTAPNAAILNEEDLPPEDTTPPSVPTGLAMTSAAETRADGTIIVTLTSTWNDDNVADFDRFQFSLREQRPDGTTWSPWVEFDQTVPVFIYRPAAPNRLYEGKVRAWDRDRNRSAYSGVVQHTTVGDTAAPSTPASLSVVNGFQVLWLSWAAVSDKDLAFYEIYENTVNSAPSAGNAATYSAGGTTFVRDGLGDNVTRYFWVRAVDTSGNKSAWSSVASGTTTYIAVEDMSPTLPDAPQTPTLSQSLNVNPDGTISAKLIVAINYSSATTHIVHYDVGVTEGAANEVQFSTAAGSGAPGGSRIEVNARPGFTYTVRARAVNKAGAKSNWSPNATHAFTGDTTAPAAPTSVASVALFRSIWLSWGEVADKDLSHYEGYASSSSTAPGAGTAATFTTKGTAFTLSNLSPGDVRYCWIRSVDHSGNKSGWTASAQNPVTVQAITAATDIANALITAEHFVSGLEPPLIVAAVVNLPTPSASYRPKNAFVRSEKRLYTLNAAGTAWEPHDVQAAQVVGQLIAAQIAAGAITAEKMSVVARNLINSFAGFTAGVSPLTDTTTEGWNSVTAGQNDVVLDSTIGNTPVLQQRANHGATIVATTDYIEIDPSVTYAISFGVKSATNARATFRVMFYDKDRAQILNPNIKTFDPLVRSAPGTNGQSFADLYDVTSVRAAYEPVIAYLVPNNTIAANIKTGLNATSHAVIPANCRYIRIQPRNTLIGGLTGGPILWYSPAIRDVEGGQLHAQNLTADSITSREMTTEALTATAAQIATAWIENAHIVSLDAAKITAGTVLAGSIKVGSSGGSDLSTIQGQAANPASGINAGATLIDPGKILISGATTLSNWRDGGDNTRIAGGSIAANSITANKLEIGSRGISIEGVEVWAVASANSMRWGSGTIRYTRDDGSATGDPDGYVTVNANGIGVTWSTGTMYLYWVKGASDPADGTAVNLSTSVDPAVAHNPNNLVIAAYRGGSNLVTNYGRTRIDGNFIQTGTVHADRLIANTVGVGQLSAGEIITLSAQIANAIITDAKIVSLSAAKIVAGTALVGSITVDGTALSNVRDWSADPGSRVNLAGNTQINPGRIIVDGGTTLADWRTPGDLTKIDGGRISTGSIHANRITASTISGTEINTNVLTAEHIISDEITRVYQALSNTNVNLTVNLQLLISLTAEPRGGKCLIIFSCSAYPNGSVIGTYAIPDIELHYEDAQGTMSDTQMRRAAWTETVSSFTNQTVRGQISGGTIVQQIVHNVPSADLTNKTYRIYARQTVSGAAVLGVRLDNMRLVILTGIR